MEPTKITCPLGNDCEDIVDGELTRCAWYTKLIGKDPQSGEDVDQWGCAISWLPLMLVENSNQLRGMKAATESFRNESVKGQETFNNLIATALERKRLSE